MQIKQIVFVIAIETTLCVENLGSFFVAESESPLRCSHYVIDIGISMKSLLDLNDDCLIEIFKYLSLVEAFKVIDVRNARLTEIAHQRISTFKELNITIREFPNFNAEQLRIIGENIYSLSMTCGYSIPTQNVLNIMQPLCKGAAATNQLRVFSLNYVYFNKEYCQYIGNAAAKLQKLNLNYCQLTDKLLTDLLKSCNDLLELEILGNYTLNGEFLNKLHLPTLRVLKLELHAEWNYPMENFKIKNPNVKLII
ncbi:uncharacterized protein LOC126753470 isoform X2 [Bactrocera neohumeralis]|uniref:uncharacterized protein LOC126753470 isoform X2 n=1 Tax=Bactrocera neohumeralis TaxID=98809 RepID=UPI002165CB57|nr:uncharacterized protein LOC126753470 isoform X2 [Bactrocera neohumeralis]